ncbi:hypothetical protein [Bacillus wiedmannii]|uniref:hypothetical protein n=1 Tax=Bacillus wiedmannii TaxID=1890302 RepID=UPI00086D0F54|nr:hypothetical protein [Bacillus wiedmannii]SCN06843.1 Protein of unknown function [Bacillus wiedmannii]
MEYFVTDERLNGVSDIPANVTIVTRFYTKVRGMHVTIHIVSQVNQIPQMIPNLSQS